MVNFDPQVLKELGCYMRVCTLSAVVKMMCKKLVFMRK